MTLEVRLAHLNLAYLQSDSPLVHNEIGMVIKDIEDEIRSRTNKTLGKANVEKCAKAILKAASESPQETLHKSNVINGIQYFSDGHRILRLENPIDAEVYEFHEGQKPFDFESLFTQLNDNCDKVILFDRAKYLGDYKAFKAKTKAKKIIYSFGEGLPCVNAHFLADFCNIGDIKEIKWNKTNYPLGGKLNDIEFLLLPVKAEEEFEGFKAI